MNKPFHVTKNLKFAAALSACGAEVLDTDKIRRDGRDELVFTLDEQATGICAKDAARLWNNTAKGSLETLVDGIIASRGITPEEYALMQLEAARAALNNRGVLLKCGLDRKPLVLKTLKSGRQVTYREGTTKEELRKLIN